MLTENRVMAVDDDITNLAIIREAIGERCELRTVLDGETAIQLAREFRPNVILLDIMMPLMDGYEVCRRIRKDPIAKYCQIILVSAKTEVTDRLKGYEAGADDYLTKPFVDDELEAKVHVALKSRTVDEFTIVREQVERMCGLHGQSLAIQPNFTASIDTFTNDPDCLMFVELSWQSKVAAMTYDAGEAVQTTRTPRLWHDNHLRHGKVFGNSNTVHEPGQRLKLPRAT